MLEVSQLRIRDTENVWAMYKKVQAASKVPLGGRWNFDKISNELQYGEGWGIFYEQKLTGFILMRTTRYEVEITLVAVSPDYQRSGFMTQLMKKVNDLYPQPKYLEVHAGNRPAQKFYETIGFERVGERRFYYRDGGHAHLYRLL